MKQVAIFVLLFAVGMSVNLKLSPLKKVEELKQSKFGRTLLTMMQLHSQVHGPLEELIEAVDELVADINQNLEELDYDYQVRTNEHNIYVNEVEQELQDAEQDIARMDDVIDNLLLPRKVQIQNRIRQLNDNLDYNRDMVKESTLQRKNDHESYELQVIEFNEALEAVDDALNLLSQLTPTLIQIKTLKLTFRKIPAQSWTRVQQGPLLLALIQLAAKSNFADQSLVKEIVDALYEFRNQAVDTLNEMTKLEAEQQVEFEERLIQLDDEYAEFQKQIVQMNVDLTAVIEKIKDCQQFLDQRISDQAQYQAQLDLENETFAVETEIFTNAKNDLLRELGVAEQGLSLIKSADFSNIRI